MTSANETWDSGSPYDYFMGRWSQRMAPVFLKWLNAPQHLQWLDLGCGTGALSEAILSMQHPKILTCMDPSAEFLSLAKEKLKGDVDFINAGAEQIPKPDGSFDIIVSGLAINFIPHLDTALREMKRVLKHHGLIAAYVWDYADRMEFLRMFWDTAVELNPEARSLDEGVRFSHCSETNLIDAFRDAGIRNVETEMLDIETTFENFADYWQPFLSKQGPAPGYVATLNEAELTQLRNSLEEKLPLQKDGTIKLIARAIAIRGECN